MPDINSAIRSQHAIADLLARYQAGFNVLGRLTVLKHAQQITGKRLRFATANQMRQFADGGDDAAIDVSFDLPATGAVDYLRNLTPFTRDVFDQLTNQYRNDAITIAGVNDQRIIARVQEALAGTIASGGTNDDFRKAVNEITDAAGLERLAAFELNTVFYTNTLKAYSMGRYEQLTDDSVQDALPFWQYWTVGDDRVRPAHAALDGFIALAADPVWRKIYPPCGFNCRCSVAPLMHDEALDINPNAMDDGMMRLPVLAVAEVPQPGFTPLLSA